MGTTPKLAIPYVEPADLLANYPVADKAQADRVEYLLATDPTPRASRYKSAPQPIDTAAVPFTVLYDVDLGDGTGITYNAASGVFTVPTSGVYQVNASIHFQVGAGTGSLRLIIVINGQQKLVLIDKNSVSFSMMGSRAYRLAAGDTIAIQAQSSITGCGIFGSGTQYTTVDITRLAT
jgi:hypothetical protein